MIDNKKTYIFIALLIILTISITVFAEKSSLIKTEKKITENTKNNPLGNNTFVKKTTVKKTSFLNLFNKGGFFMWPLLILAALSMGFTIERLIFFKNAKLNPIKFTVKLEDTISGKSISDVEVFCKKNNYLISKIVSKGLKVKDLGYEKVEKILSVAGGVEVSALEKGLNILSSIGTIAPMIGFLGTTSGMIMAFSDIAAADRVSAKIVAGGIEEALLTTAAGLLVAIPTLFSYNYFIHRIDLFATNIERISSDTIEKLIHEEYDEDKKKS